MVLHPPSTKFLLGYTPSWAVVKSVSWLLGLLGMVLNNVITESLVILREVLIQLKSKHLLSKEPESPKWNVISLSQGTRQYVHVINKYLKTIGVIILEYSALSPRRLEHQMGLHSRASAVVFSVPKAHLPSSAKSAWHPTLFKSQNNCHHFREVAT